MEKTSSSTMTSKLPAERLSRFTKIIYGLGDWGNTTTSTIFGFFFAYFLNNVAGVQPIYAFPILLIGGIWDAVNDPLIGVWADKIRTRWGRRRPLFFAGAIPYGLTFILLFIVPSSASQIVKCIYYSFVYIAFDTFFTLVTVPYCALTPELTEDYDERTRLNGYRMFVSVAGGLIAAIVFPLIWSSFASNATGFLVGAIIFGSLAGIPYILLFFFIRERYADTEKSDLNVISGFLYTWRNVAFRYAATVYMTAWVTVTLAGSLLPYYLTYWLRRPGEIDFVLGTMMISATIFVPVIVLLANKWGKQKPYIIAVCWWAIMMMVISFLPRNVGVFVYIIAFAIGFGVAAAHVIPWSIVPDVIEADELETGFRREGTYYGFVVFLQKTGSAAALGIMELVLHFTGFVSPPADADLTKVTQLPSTLTAIRWMMGPFPTILLLLSAFLVWRYPIDKIKHIQLRRALAEKRAQKLSSK
jgi:GPH family glycoside/pentoside/hexuronide:cation symporter